MRPNRSAADSWLCLVLAAGVLSCDGQRVPLQPPVPASVVRVDLGGPETVPPGGTATFTATARMSDGTTRDVTHEALWRSSLPSVLSIAAGVATAHGRGDTFVSAVFKHVESTREVIVVPDGTFRLMGLVTEFPNDAAVLAEAVVDVVAGVGAGLSTTTRADGRYRLYGVAEGTELRVTKPGYQPLMLSVPLQGGHRALNVELHPVSPRAEVAGTYAMTITAAAPCRDHLRDDLRSRTYSARLTQDGPLLEVTLSGAQFAVSRNGRGDRFRGRVEPAGLSFSLTPYVLRYYGYEQYPDLAETVPGGYLIIDGTALLNGPPAHLAGALTGAYQFLTFDPAWGGHVVTECRGDHPFVLSRAGS